MADIITVMNLGWQYAPAQQYSPAAQALQNITCYVQEGSFIGVIGPTGSGKTTFVKALVGLIPHCTAGAISGFVRIADMNVKSTSVSNLSSEVGYVGQNPREQLCCATVSEELAFPLENRGIAPENIRARVDELCRDFEIEHLRDRFTDTLSTGEMERVAIAAALAHIPRVLILDEPSASLDEEGRRSITQLLDRIHREHGITVVVVEQVTALLAQYADTIFVMVGGEMIRRTSNEIFTRESALLESIGVIVPDAHDHQVSLDDSPVQVTHPVVSFDHVNFAYPHALQHDAQLNELSIAVEQGAFVGVTGPNGAGKSTMVRLMNGILHATNGQIVVNGKQVARTRTDAMAREVAFVPQDPSHMFFHGTVHDEIANGPRALGCDEQEVNRRVRELIRLFDLFEVEDVPAQALSNGGQRAVALACALAMQTPILVLDEPVAGLDHRLTTRFLNMVARLNAQGTTVIMVCQDSDIIQRYCSHVMQLDHGHLVSYHALRNAREHFIDHTQSTQGLAGVQ